MGRAATPDGFLPPEEIIRHFDQLYLLPKVRRNQLHFNENEFDGAQAPLKYPEVFGNQTETVAQRSEATPPPPPPPEGKGTDAQKERKEEKYAPYYDNARRADKARSPFGRRRMRPPTGITAGTRWGNLARGREEK